MSVILNLVLASDDPLSVYSVNIGVLFLAFF